MFVASVTGTNGKTSIVELARQLLASTDSRAGSWGTLGVADSSGRRRDPHVGFGPEAAPRFLSRLQRRGLEALFFEAHSVALAQGLLDQVTIDAAVFTTFGRDHLDFHGTRDAYFQAKKRLFEQVASPETIAILNADADRFEELEAVSRRRGLPIHTYSSADKADAQLIGADPIDEGLRIRARFYDQEVELEVSLFTVPMAENLLAASLASVAAGQSVENVIAGWESIQTPPGRIERVAHHEGCEIYIDYAHTPDALASSLVSLGRRSKGRCLLVFGCGGERDEGKRAAMGRVAREYADRAFVTDDNPREENPSQIRAQILKACPEGLEIPDRREAIRRAIEVSQSGDIVLIAGKGHEEHQIRGDTHRPFSDRKVVRELAV